MVRLTDVSICGEDVTGGALAQLVPMAIAVFCLPRLARSWVGGNLCRCGVMSPYWAGARQAGARAGRACHSMRISRGLFYSIYIAQRLNLRLYRGSAKKFISPQWAKTRSLPQCLTRFPITRTSPITRGNTCTTGICTCVTSPRNCLDKLNLPCRRSTSEPVRPLQYARCRPAAVAIQSAHSLEPVHYRAYRINLICSVGSPERESDLSTTAASGKDVLRTLRSDG